MSRSVSARPHSLLRRGRTVSAVLGAAMVVSVVGAASAAAAPPGNDSRATAQSIGTLPIVVSGTTVEATLEADDPSPMCGGALKGSVWYSFAPSQSRSVLFALAAAGDMDATVDVFTRVRSQLSAVECATTDRRGEAIVDLDVSAGTGYVIRVAPLANSVADRFTLRAVAPDDPAKSPGDRLPAKGVAGSVDRFANPDDAWFVDLVQGRTYRLNFVTKGPGCAAVELFPAGTRNFNSASPLRRRSCDAHTVFVASKSGRYPMLVRAPRASRTVLPYRLRVGLALADDTAPGRLLAVDTDVAGRLHGSELDALDLYRFGVAQSSDMSLRLRTKRRFELTLMTERGRTLDVGSHLIERRLKRGHYFVAVRALDGANGAYVLRRHARAITSAAMLVNGRRGVDVATGRTVQLGLQVSPSVSGPSTMLVERFDPNDGWLFAAQFHPTVVSGRATVSYRPSGVGRWRVTGSFDGTSNASPSFGGTARFTVAEPLALLAARLLAAR